MPKQNKTRYALLGMLSLNPMSGYDIKKAIETRIGLFWNESYGQIYPALKRLVDEGLATGQVEGQEDKPDRIVYSLTSAGEAELRRWLSEPVEHEARRLEILLKLFFGRLASRDDMVRLLRRFRATQAAILQKCRAEEQRVRKAGPKDANLPYALMAARYDLHVSLARMNWCDEAVAMIEGETRVAVRESVQPLVGREVCKPLSLPFLNSNPLFADFGAVPPISR